MNACDFTELAVAGVRSLQPYQPGKPESELRREYGIENIIKLASNENPLGPSPRALSAISAQLGELARYPDGNGFELKQALAKLHHIGSEQIILGNGSNDVLELIARAFLDSSSEALFSEHAFAVYPLATQAVGATMRIAKAHCDHRPMPYGHDLAAFSDLVNDRTRVVFIANPNNPTGTWLHTEELQVFIEAVPEQTLVVIDEAYSEYVETAEYPNTITWLERYPNLIVTRTFSKAYGLAGLRVGYGVANAQIIDLLNRVRQPFNVNSLGLCAALAALGDDDFLAQSRAANRTGMQQLRNGLQALGLACLPSVANFLCVKLDRPGQEIFQALLSKGVIVRPIANYGLPEFIRVTIGSEAQNELLLQTLGDILRN